MRSSIATMVRSSGLLTRSPLGSHVNTGIQLDESSLCIPSTISPHETILDLLVESVRLMSIPSTSSLGIDMSVS